MSSSFGCSWPGLFFSGGRYLDHILTLRHRMGKSPIISITTDILIFIQKRCPISMSTVIVTGLSHQSTADDRVPWPGDLSGCLGDVVNLYSCQRLMKLQDQQYMSIKWPLTISTMVDVFQPLFCSNLTTKLQQRLATTV